MNKQRFFGLILIIAFEYEVFNPLFTKPKAQINYRCYNQPSQASENSSNTNGGFF
jgi:hypothetical protein